MALGEALFEWLSRNRDDIRREAEHRNMEFEQFLISMLDDALEAYKSGRNLP